MAKELKDDELKELAKHNTENSSKTHIYGILGYICLAICIVCSVFAKWVWAGVFGVALVVFSLLESHFDKKRVDNALEESLKVKDSNFKNLK